MKKNTKVTYIIVAIIVIGVVYWFFFRKKKSEDTPEPVKDNGGGVVVGASPELYEEVVLNENSALSSTDTATTDTNAIIARDSAESRQQVKRSDILSSIPITPVKPVLTKLTEPVKRSTEELKAVQRVASVNKVIK